MKLTWKIVGLILIAGVIFYFAYLKPRLAEKKIEYTYTALEQGDIESTISTTGTIEAVNTVQVGTQISGTISKIYVDHNDKVRQGQLLAKMDTRLLQTSLENAKANVAVASTKVHQAKDEFLRNSALYDKKVINEKEFKDSEYLYEQTLSNEKSALAAERTSEVNLGYAHIMAPIAGTITERRVEEGQTVAASFATPTLFIIAEDLSKMQILANVDESDIGYIYAGMTARFTVQTYPNKNFFGRVTEVRLQPVTINNVVNYIVVVDVDNKRNLLLPGMTANIDFIVETGKNVLLINNSALRFHPDVVLMNKLMPTLKSKAEALPDSIKGLFLASLNSESPATAMKRSLPSGYSGVFYVTDSKSISFDFVELGITTGLQSEIKSFVGVPQLPVGFKFINGVKKNSK